MTWAPRELASATDGLLAFPVTPFDQDGALDVELLREHVEMLLSFGARALFPACGTGEMQSLSMDEYRQVVQGCVDQVGGRVPVLPGIGFGYGIAQQMASCAQESGADGVLVFPPYLSGTEGERHVDYYTALASSVHIGVVVYQRDAAVFSSSAVVRLAAVPNIFAIKDGTGRIELLQKQRMAAAGSGLAFINGVPTAELLAPSLAECGITAYSSALLNFVPELAIGFYDALTTGDTATVERLLRDLVVPFVEMRDRAPGYAVSLVKAGVRMRGRDVGPVRSPLPEPTAADLHDLRTLIAGLGCSGPLAQGVGAPAPASVGARVASST
jgi:5-dehydro-4-deoxyglucarate dehydratase